MSAVSVRVAVVPGRSVIENVYLGIEDSTLGVVKGRKLEARFDELVERTGIRVPARALVRQLSPHDQQKVEILRALARDARFIVMDGIVTFLPLTNKWP